HLGDQHAWRVEAGERVEHRSGLEQRVVGGMRVGRVPAAAVQPELEGRGRLLRDRAEVVRAPAEDTPLAAALVEPVAHPQGLRMLAREPRRAEVDAHLLIRGEGEDDVAGGLHALTRQRREGDRSRSKVTLHVEGAASPDLAVDEVARPGIAGPLRRLREHRVGMRQQHEPGTVASLEPRHHVRPVGCLREAARRDAVPRQVALQRLRGARLVARRVDGVEPDKLLQELGDLLAEGHRPSNHLGLGLRPRRQLVPDLPELREEHGLHEPAEHLDGRSLRPDDAVPDHPRDDAVVADSPRLAPLVDLDHRLREAVQRIVVTTADVQLREREPLLPAPGVEGLPEPGERDTQRPPAGRVEPAAVTQHLADLLVLPGRQLLEHVELVRGVPQAAERPAELARGLLDVALLDEPRRLLDVARGELQPELRRLVDDLEEELVAVHPLVRPLLQCQQLVRPDVSLVVARRVAREDRGVVVLTRRRHRGEHTGRVGDLFSDAAATRAHVVAPLPQRVRPRTLDELVGQTSVLGPGTALRRAIEEGRAPSMILHGPPGVGKTTIARIVAEASDASFEELSAVSARVDDVRAVLARARDRLGGNDVRTLLFIDEIHRFDKRQQDSVLHAVEDGLVTLIGATTENPYFEVNQALLSRCTVIELQPLTVEELGLVLERGAAELGADVAGDVSEAIARRSGGDARTALQTLELAWETA